MSRSPVALEVCLLTTEPSLPACPQRGRPGPGALREAAALQPPEVQLLPLCARAVRPAGPACGGGEDRLCGLCGERQGGTGIYGDIIMPYSSRLAASNTPLVLVSFRLLVKIA